MSEELPTHVDGEAAYDIVQDAISYAKANLDSSRMMYLNEVLNMFEIYALKKKLEVNPWEGLIPQDTTNMAQCTYCNEWTEYTIVSDLKVSVDHNCKRG